MHIILTIRVKLQKPWRKPYHFLNFLSQAIPQHVVLYGKQKIKLVTYQPVVEHPQNCQKVRCLIFIRLHMHFQSFYNKQMSYIYNMSNLYVNFQAKRFRELLHCQMHNSCLKLLLVLPNDHYHKKLYYIFVYNDRD